MTLVDTRRHSSTSPATRIRQGMGHACLQEAVAFPSVPNALATVDLFGADLRRDELAPEIRLDHLERLACGVAIKITIDGHPEN